MTGKRALSEAQVCVHVAFFLFLTSSNLYQAFVGGKVSMVLGPGGAEIKQNVVSALVRSTVVGNTLGDGQLQSSVS